ncbi:hypothetical protein ES708_08346 [subsurface metagenome]
MNIKVPQVIDVLMKYGSFARPLVNFALSNDKLNSAWKEYFKAIRYDWQKEHTLELKCIERGIKRCKDDQTVKYLLLAQELSVLQNLKVPEGNRLYIQLRREFHKVPKLARKTIATTLLSYPSLNAKETDLPKTRLWSQYYQNDMSTQVFILLGKAREKIKTGNITEGIALYFKGLRIAKTIPHPIGIIDNLNDSAWYIRHSHPHWALRLANQAIYWVGWYREDARGEFYVFDTFFEIQRIVSDQRLCETASLIASLQKHLPSGQGRGAREYYKDTIQDCKYFIFDLKGGSVYKNSDSLRNYLRRFMKSISSVSVDSNISRGKLSALLNGKTKTVRGETIRKLIKGLKLNLNPLNDPTPLINEWMKIKIEDAFFDSLEKLKGIKPNDRIISLLLTYMTFFDRKEKLPYLSRKGILERAIELCTTDMNEFTNFMSHRYETMRFTSDMINEMHPFIEGRKDLVRKFLGKMPKKRMKIFAVSYAELTEGDRKTVDAFARNYTRYDLELEIYVGLPVELKEFVKFFHLKKRPSILASFVSGRPAERNKILRVLQALR